MDNGFNNLNNFGGDSGDNYNKKTYDFYEVNKEPVLTPPPVQPEPKKKKEKKPGSGIGKKFGMCITMALVFGLVAGLVFQGVNVVGNKLLGTDNSSAQRQVDNVQMVPSTSGGSEQASNDSDSNATKLSAGTLSVADIANNAMPSVVAITAVSVQEVQDFFGGTQQYEDVGSGSGIIVGQNDEELLIATNNHVIENAKNVSVSFYGDDVDASALESGTSGMNQDMEAVAEEYAKNSVAAQIKGTDAENDLAVVAVQKSDIPEETLNQIKVATIGDSDSLVVGEQVVAIGNALGYGQSVTSGYVSALNRSINMENTADSLIQTDAAINPGNSGGALLNMQGELVGINSAKFADETVEGMGFAIPISTAQPILDDLMNRETRSKVDEDKAAYMGITCMNVSAEVSQMYNLPSGVFVSEVEKDGPAEQAGIQSGDIITSLDGTKVSSYDEMTSRLEYYAAGETIEIIVQRADSGQYVAKTLTITLGSRKDAQ